MTYPWTPPRKNAPAVDAGTEPADVLAEVAHLEAEREWRPIETAPRDGTPFWGRDGENAIRMLWHDGFKAFVSSWRCMIMAEGYTFNGETEHEHSPVTHEPKFWMPLPAGGAGDGKEHPALHHGPSADHTIPEGPALRRVILESPYAAPDRIGIEANTDYARRAMRDSLMRGEAPLASHLLYTQPGILDDGHPDERRLGIEAGLTWLPAAEATVVYADRGITPGMQQGIDRAHAAGRPVEVRYLDTERSPLGDGRKGAAFQAAPGQEGVPRDGCHAPVGQGKVLP